LLALLSILLTSVAPVTAGEVKMATLSPDGSPWDKILEDMGKEWEQGTSGRVTLQIYPGGVAGDEPDILRKMKIGQYHAAALSVAGLVDIDKNFTVFQIPLFYRDFDEMKVVLDGLSPTLEKNLEDNGFVLLGWGYVGWVYFFTTKPARTVEEMKQLKIFTWAGDDVTVQWWRRNGFKPVPLAATDIVTGLQTGMIEAISVPPLYAMQVQFFKQANYLSDQGLAPMMGAMLMSKRNFDRLSDADKKVVLAAGKKAEERVLRDIPKLDETAIKLMQSQGLNVVEVEGTEAGKEWITAAEEFAIDMRGDIVPTAIFDQAKKLRDDHRSRTGAATSGAGSN
jgi:TRAP-type C4-dicarboxylate transport system substrate-binding protein